MRLHEWLQQTGTSLSALSRETAVSYNTLHQLKKQRHALVRYDLAKRISDATGGAVTIEDLCSVPEAADAAG